MKVIIFLVLFVICASADARNVLLLDKEQFRTLHDSMIRQTFPDSSQLAQMGGFPCPSLLVYSPVEQRFISDQQKFNLLNLSSLAWRVTLFHVPAIIQNRPTEHPFFANLPLAALKQFLPDADVTKEYIFIYCSQTMAAAQSTERLLAQFIAEGAEDKQGVALPDLILHLDNQLMNKPAWQVFMYKASD